MKIKLVNPAALDDQGQPRKFYQDMMLGLTLPYLAGLIGPGHEIQIVNESVQDLNFDEPVDLVGITAMTSRISRGVQIAEQYRRRGVPVVIGGHHATMLPDEVAPHADAVVVGESEGLWEDILADAGRGSLRPLYRRESFPELKGLPSPRYDLVDQSHYWFPAQVVQAVRGCPYNCAFCSVTRFYGGGFRYRPVSEVLADVRHATGALFFFADDNILSHRDYCLELFAGLKPLGKMWYAQAAFADVGDAEFLRRARESGCVALYLGIESFDPQVRRRIGKHPVAFTQEEAGGIFRMLQRHGIEVLASMIVDPETDSPESLEQTIEFLIRNPVAALYLYILTPVPQTRLHARLERDGILVSHDWSRYDGLHCLYPPRSVSPEQLEAEFWKAQQKFYSLSSILRRYFKLSHYTLILHNLVYRQLVNEKIHPLLGLRRPHPVARLNSFLMSLNYVAWMRRLSKR